MTPDHELNAWRELGEEMGRIVSMMTPADKSDYLPDWFGPRLFDLQVRAGDGNQPPSGFRGDPGGSSGQKDSTRDPVTPCSCCISEITRLQGEVEALEEVLKDTQLEFARHMDEWNAMRAQLAKAEATLQELRPYIRHELGCWLMFGTRNLVPGGEGFGMRFRTPEDGEPHCTCGLDQLLDPPALLPSAAVAPEKDTQ